jgi:lipopolysaccharide biosynthesis protein
MRRAGVVAHYDPQNQVDAYVVNLVRELRTVCERVVFISTSALPQGELDKLGQLVDHAVLRQNVGHDFASYRQGLLELEPLGFDEIVLANDSVYGPLAPFSEVFARMSEVEADVWSASASWDIAFHLQSYFLVFRARALAQPIFWRFWKSMRLPMDRRTLIRRGEVGLSFVLARSGMRLRAVLPPATILDGMLSCTDPRESLVERIPDLPGLRRLWLVYVLIQALLHATWDMSVWREVATLRRINLTHSRWRRNVRRGLLLFIKVDLLRDHPARPDIQDLDGFLRRTTRYDPELIAIHRGRLATEPPRQRPAPPRAGRGRRLIPPRRAATR